MSIRVHLWFSIGFGGYLGAAMSKTSVRILARTLGSQPLSGSAGSSVRDLYPMRSLLRAWERGLERRLFCGLLRVLERALLRWPLR